jgi:hypothetical protein
LLDEADAVTTDGCANLLGLASHDDKDALGRRHSQRGPDDVFD